MYKLGTRSLFCFQSPFWMCASPTPHPRFNQLGITKQYFQISHSNYLMVTSFSNILLVKSRVRDRADEHNKKVEWTKWQLVAGHLPKSYLLYKLVIMDGRMNQQMDRQEQYNNNNNNNPFITIYCCCGNHFSQWHVQDGVFTV